MNASITRAARPLGRRRAASVYPGRAGALPLPKPADLLARRSRARQPRPNRPKADFGIARDSGACRHA